uniref:NADH-ubiquinone oxidoreductase chain 4L n=1 Tax=Laevipilina hyalina TaxID=651133 RepID=A0A1W6LQL1_9MOLL|nr:NADH dehydrogenase subunit 4L [Laevipilina hyalina]
MVAFPALGMMLQKNHFLNVLLFLESFSLIIFTLLVMHSKSTNMGSPLLLIFMTFSACEAAMGLGLLISILRATGNDYIHAPHNLKF